MQCPNCENQVSTSQNFCRECGTDVSDISAGANQNSSQEESGIGSITSKLSEKREQIEGDVKEQIQDRKEKKNQEKKKHQEYLDCHPQGDWVNERRVKKVSHLLDDDSKVHYMWKSEIISATRSNHIAVTNKRIVVAVPQITGSDERHIPYHSISTVDLNIGVVNKEMSIKTNGRDYNIQAQGPSKGELRDATKFIRQKIKESNQPQQTDRSNQPQQNQTASEPDPTEQLQQISQLHEDGVLTDEEFEEKKQSILDKI